MPLFDIPSRKFLVACMKMNIATWREREREAIIETEKRGKERVRDRKRRDGGVAGGGNNNFINKFVTN